MAEGGGNLHAPMMGWRRDLEDLRRLFPRGHLYRLLAVPESLWHSKRLRQAEAEAEAQAEGRLTLRLKQAEGEAEAG